MELYTRGNSDSFQPVYEMKNFQDIKHMTKTVGKMKLPNNKQDPTHGFMFFTLNTSLKSIVSILMNEHPLLSNNGKLYRAYYYNHLLLRKGIQSKRIPNSKITNVQAKQKRIETYNQLKSYSNEILTPIKLETLRKRNFIYDIQPIIDLMKPIKKISKFPLIQKMDMYFQTISYFYNTKLYGYEKSSIFINLDEYSGQESIENYHYLTFLMLLLRKPKKIIEKYQKYFGYKIIFYTNKGYLLFDTSTDVKKENYSKLKLLLKKLKPESNLEEIITKVERDEIAVQLNQKMYFSGNSVSDETEMGISDTGLSGEDEVVGKISKEVTAKTDIGIDEEEAIDNMTEEIESDPELKLEYVKAITNKSTGKSAASLERDKLLREKQQKIKIKGKTIAELRKEKSVPLIKENVIETAPHVNQKMNTVKFSNFEKTYNEELYDRHMANVITCFNDKTINVNVVDVKVEDTSTTSTMQETYTIVMEDENRKRHTMKVNIPKMVDDKFFYINGNKKTIQKQIFALPVIKTGPDEVQICTNYNKIFIRRYGTKFNPNVERFKKWIEDPKNQVKVSKGYNTTANKGKLTCLEYDELGSHYNRITINNCTFVFNVELLMNETNNQYQSSLEKILIGYRTNGTKKEPIYYNSKDENHVDMVSTIIQESKPEAYDEFKKLSYGKKYIHTKATIMAKDIPVVILICFFEGLTKVIRKFDDPNVKFVDKKNTKDNNMYIQFADGYLTYPMSDTEACIMFNGFTELLTSKYTIAEMDQRETYLDIFEIITGSSYIAGALINYYDFMIDPITLDILKMMDYPEDIVSLIIFANNMLADSQYVSDINFNMYRIRSNEVIPALLYKQMTIAYSKYRKTINNNAPMKLSVDPDCVIKALQELPTVEDYSKLSPIGEIKQSYNSSMKGYVGMNMDRAYNQEKRIFDDSMIGVVGVSTDNAANCGKDRHLVLEPTVMNAYGMMKLNNRKNPDELDETQLETPVELLTPSGTIHDDPVRTAMATKQSGHTIPVKDESPLLVTNGMDSTIQYRTGNDFSVVAKEDGEVIDYDENLQIMVVRYKSGEKQAIDLDTTIAKNGGGGIFLRNQLQTSFKKGDKFKKNAILAFDKYFYKDTGLLGNKLTFGTLVKSAIMSHFSTYEDSTWVTSKLSKRMATDVTKCKRVVLGKNANVDYIVHKGDNIKIGDELIRFEASYDDAEMSRLLANVRDDLQEEIVNLGKTRITSHYTGVVEDVIAYPAVDKDELSPSLRKVVNDCQKLTRDRQKFLDKYDDGNRNAAYRIGVLMNKPEGKIEPDRFGKIKGEDVTDSVLLEFYITYHDELSDGDKLTHMTANKATVGYVVPKYFEPYSEFRPNEEISIPLAPSAILQRGTPSIINTVCAYKVLIELKRKCYEILTGEDYNEKLKRDNPYMVHDKNQNSVSEAIEMDDSLLTVMEDTFDIQKGETGYYSAGKTFMMGDIVVANNSPSIYDMDWFTKHVKSASTSNEYPNIYYDAATNTIRAKSIIYTGETFVM